jgi:hypothetical protein
LVGWVKLYPQTKHTHSEASFCSGNGLACAWKAETSKLSHVVKVGKIIKRGIYLK